MNARSDAGSAAVVPGVVPLIPEHELLRRIGEGAYGEVWLARNRTGALRAVKLVYRKRFSDSRPFEREFKGITRFEPVSRSTEGLINVLQVGRDSATGFFYYVMELGDDAGENSNDQSPNQENEQHRNSAESDPAGPPCSSELAAVANAPALDLQSYVPKTLSSEASKRGRLPFEECLQLGLSLSLALGRLHRHGLLHRDVKPSNIIFVGGLPKLADIGLVTEVAEARSYVGTEGFIPPDGPNSPQADLYALGKVLYEISMGKDRQEFPEPRTALVEDPEAPALLELNAIVLKACALNPRERYQSAEDMHADLALLHSGRSVKRKHSLERRVAWMSKVGPAVTALALLATTAFLMQRHQTDEIKRLAGDEARQRTRAEGALTMADENLVRLKFKRAEEALASDRAALGLAELAAILRQHPTNLVAAQRLWAALTQKNFLLPLIPPIRCSTNITVAKFGPDGRMLFLGAEDGAGRIWDSYTGRPASPPLTHPAGVLAAAFRDTNLLTVSRDGVLREWNPQRQNIEPAVELHQAPALAAFSSDARYLGLVRTDQTVQFWDLRSRKLIGELNPELESVDLMVFSPAANTVAIAGRSKGEFSWMARVWDVPGCAPRTPPLKHLGQISEVAFDSKGTRLVTAAKDFIAQVWNATNGARLGPVLQHRGWVFSADFAPEDGRIATSSADRTVQIWDALTGRALDLPLQHGTRVIEVRFSPEGRRLLTVTANGRIYLWDALTHDPLTEPAALAVSVRSAQFTPDGERVLTLSEDNTARIFSSHPSQSLSWPFYAQNALSVVSFSPDGRRIAFTDTRDSAWLCNLWAEPSEPIALLHRSGVNAVEFSPDGSKVVTASSDKTARVWDAFSGKALTEPLPHNGIVYSASFDHLGNRVVTASADGTGRVWDVPSGKMIGEALRHSNEVFFAEFSPDGRQVATASADGSARIWQLDPPSSVITLRHGDAVNEAHFSPTGRLLLTSSDDRTARVWDWKTGLPISAQMPHNNIVGSSAFSSDERRVVTSSSDGTARIWEAATGKPLSESLQHEDYVEFVRFSPDGKRITTASRDNSARIWDGLTGQPLTEPLRHDSTVHGAIFSPNQQWMLTCSQDHTARLWETPPQSTLIPPWLSDLAETVAGWKLDAQDIPVPVSDADYWRTRENILASRAEDAYSRWARWFFADRQTRTISPSAPVTLDNLQARVLEQDTPERIAESLHLAPAHPLALVRAARRTAKGDPGTNHIGRALADWWSHYAILQASPSIEVWRGRAEVLKDLGDMSAALAALQRAIEIEPRPDLWAAKGHWLESIGETLPACNAFDCGLAAATNCPGDWQMWIDRLHVERVNARRQLGLEKEALQELMSLKHFQLRPATATPALLDLTLFFNARPDEDWHSRSDKGNNLADLPLGIHNFGGVQFDVRGIVQLSAENSSLEPEFPDRLCGMKVGHACRRIHFLHGTGWIAPEGTEMAYWILHYANGGQEKRSVIYGKDVRNWQFWPGMPPETGGAQPVWKGRQARWPEWTGAGIRLYETTWENPHPDTPVTTIDYVSARASSAPFLLGITVE